MTHSCAGRELKESLEHSQLLMHFCCDSSRARETLIDIRMFVPWYFWRSSSLSTWCKWKRLLLFLTWPQTPQQWFHSNAQLIVCKSSSPVQFLRLSKRCRFSCFCLKRDGRDSFCPPQRSLHLSPRPLLKCFHIPDVSNKCFTESQPAFRRHQTL